MGRFQWLGLAAGLSAASCAVESTPVSEDDEALRCTATVDVDPRKSLYVTDNAILLTGGQDFSLRRTLGQLAAQSGNPGLTAGALFAQWWDTQNLEDTFVPNPGPLHCDDEQTDGQASINGFPIECGRQEGQQANPAIAEAELDAYIPIGLVNRFDLAPLTGENCGEYRIVYGKVAGATRNLPIFEAKLPNPHPECGLQACRPVQEFWASLTNVASPATRAQMLATFYYVGLPGFRPVVHIDHYRGSSSGPYGGGASGQIRSNQFMQFPWNLREYVLETSERTDPPTLLVRQVTDKTNPFGPLFNGSLPGSNDPLALRAGRFQADFLGQVDALAATSLNAIGMTISDGHNAGESPVSALGDYNQQFGLDGGASRFRAALEERAQAHGLSADNVVARAKTQSCAGCHQLSFLQDLGGGLTWPASLGFVHNSEFINEPGPDGPRKRISPALTGVFLPHREQVMESFLSNTRCIACAQPLPIDRITPAIAEDGAATSSGNIGGTTAVH